ncbi:MAG: VCBS repeat-containing protein [Oligoflexia bacterium]|nr:VCBS repeat-containing protein [Oligoflexia bacterium]
MPRLTQHLPGTGSPAQTLLAQTLPYLGVLGLGALLISGCGGKDTGVGGTSGDGGTTASTTTCELALASAGDVTNDPKCLAIVDILAGMEVEWNWEGDSSYPDYNGVISTPAVGDVDGDGTPEVVFTTMAGGYYSYPGLLIVLDGVTGDEELMIDAVGDSDYVSGSSGVALADLDNDGVVEIVVTTSSSSVAAFHADGELVWSSADRADDLTLWTAPAIADLDGDGLAEVAAGRAIFGSNGAYRESSTLDGWGGISYSSIIADLDGDGISEVISGNHAFHLDGTVFFDSSKSVADGMAAVGDFDDDGQGEIVLSSWVYGTVTMLDTDGSVVWTTTISPPASKKSAGGGGPPAIADFNGDGRLEIAVYGGQSVFMLDESGDIEWEFPITDEFAYLGGLTGFDFDDDGNIEVVVTDAGSLYVLSGTMEVW